MSKLQLTYQYFRDVFIEGKSKVFTAMEWLGLLAIILPTQIAELQANADMYQALGIVIIIVSFIAANVTVYVKNKTEIHKLQQAAQLHRETKRQPATINIKSETPFKWIPGVWRGGITPDNIDCRLWFDVRNAGDERGALHKPELIFTIPQEIFSEDVTYEWFINKGTSNIPLSFPHTLQPRDLGTRIYCSVRVAFKQQGNPRFIAKRLFALRQSESSLKMAYTYENIEYERTTKHIEIPLDLNQLASTICGQWNERKVYDQAAQDLLALAECTD